MRLMLPAKFLSISLLAVGLMAGCATQPKQEPTDTGPSTAVTQALDAASAAMDNAKALDWIWRDTEDFYAAAEEAAEKGDDATAIKLANKAREQAEDAVNQYYLEKAKPMLTELRGYSLNSDQKRRMDSGATAITQGEGKRAYDILSALLAEVRSANIQYTVEPGDSLWGISARPEIYNNPYQWPLIYKANSDKISDADLIHPGQEFSIDRNPSAADVDAAVNHAKTRGAWSIGEVEASDRDYLGGLRVR